MFEVVAYIARHWVAAAQPVEDSLALRDELLDAGFAEEDVDLALTWLRRLRSHGALDLLRMEPPGRSVRCPDAREVLRVAPEARGLLERLELAGILTPALREAVYVGAVQLDVPEVGREELCVLLSLLLRASGAGGCALASRFLSGDLENFYN